MPPIPMLQQMNDDFQESPSCPYRTPRLRVPNLILRAVATSVLSTDFKSAINPDETII